MVERKVDVTVDVCFMIRVWVLPLVICVEVSGQTVVKIVVSRVIVVSGGMEDEDTGKTSLEVELYPGIPVTEKLDGELAEAGTSEDEPGTP